MGANVWFVSLDNSGINETYAARRDTQRQIKEALIRLFTLYLFVSLGPFLNAHKLNTMMWEWGDYEDAIPESDQPEPESEPDSHLNFDFFSALAKPKVLHMLT